jgi:hypothetical protein
MHEHEREGRELFNDLLADSGLDVHEIIKTFEDSISHGFIDWGKHKDYMIKLLTNPAPEDLHRLIIHGEDILQPMQAWLDMERYLNSMRKGSSSKYDYYHSEYRCSQIQNFILLLKLY